MGRPLRDPPMTLIDRSGWYIHLLHVRVCDMHILIITFMIRRIDLNILTCYMHIFIASQNSCDPN